ncbi:phosphoribosyltransferase [Escherichia coli]
MQQGKAERAEWGSFPSVIRNADLGALAKEPEYQAAKSGDMTAALDLVDRLMTDDTVERLSEMLHGRNPKVVPVLAVEESGTNKIPLAIAHVLADRLGLSVETGVVQIERVHRTNAGADHRLAFNPVFEGSVERGQSYIVVDDTLTMGGTIASLRGFLENRGGDVIAAAVMTAHAGALDMAVKPKMLTAIAEKHGTAMDSFWKENFGYGIDKLTQGEAGHLRAAASVDAIRDRISAARNEGSQRLDGLRTSAPSVPSSAESISGDISLEADAQSVEREQQALLESAPVEQVYQETLATYVQAKHDQVERIEDKLENLIEQQQVRIQQSRASQPGMLSRPSTKANWQAQQIQQQSRLQGLQGRLESVRELKESMGVHGPRVDELATRKLRIEHPGMATAFDDSQAARRVHQALMAKQEKEQKERLKNDVQQGRGHRIGLSLPR